LNRRLQAALLSGLVFPGAGQLKNRKFIRGAVFIALTVAPLAVLVYKVMSSFMGMLEDMTGDEISALRDDVPGLARTLLESDKGFFDMIGYSLLAVWAVSIVDAWFSAGKDEV